MRILLTNDDGILAPGIAAMYSAAARFGEVHVVAPASVKSATSHAVTFHRPMATRKVAVHRTAPAEGVLFEGTSVDGNPADCVKLAVHHLVPQPIDLVISGINAGANVGINVFYSGTVGAAREAAIWGIPAVAVSLHIGKRESLAWDRATAIAGSILERVLTHRLDPHTLLNINLPVLDDGAEPCGLKVAPLCTSRIMEEYACTEDGDGHKQYTASDWFEFHRKDADSDVEALFAGFVTLTPLHFDATDYEQSRRWAQRMGSAMVDRRLPAAE